jgi:hypothetical protein
MTSLRIKSERENQGRSLHRAHSTKELPVPQHDFNAQPNAVRPIANPTAATRGYAEI